MTRPIFRHACTIFVMLPILLNGCSASHSGNQVKHEIQPNHTKAKENSQAASLSLDQMRMTEAPKDEQQTPLDTVTHVVKWKFSDEKDVVPSKKNILWETHLGSEAVVATKVPKLKDSRLNLFALSFHDGKWGIKNVTDAPIDRLEDHVKGLTLPMQKYAVITSDFDGKSIWNITDGKRTVMIALYPQFSFSMPEGTKTIPFKGDEAFVNTRSKTQSLFYYFDQEKLIWIYGDLSESEIIKLANSLPSAGSPSFPEASS